MNRKLLLVSGLFVGLGAAAGLTFLQAQETDDEESDRTTATRIAIAGANSGYLGVYLEEVDDDVADRLDLREVHGAWIADVVEDGPAADAGLLTDDVIVSYNGQRVESTLQLMRFVRETPAERTVSLGVVRDGSPRTVSVTLGDRPGGGVWIAPNVRHDLPMRIHRGGDRAVSVFGGRGRLGIQMEALTDQLADYFGVDGGVLVASVHEDSPAAEAGLQAGDVITRLGDEEIEDFRDIFRAMRDVDEGPLSITYVRDGRESTTTAEIPERQSWNWRSGGGDYSFFMPSFQIPEIVIPEIRAGGALIPEIQVRSHSIGRHEDGRPWMVIPDFTIPQIDLPEILIPEIVIPELDVPAREVTIVESVEVL